MGGVCVECSGTVTANNESIDAVSIPHPELGERNQGFGT
jgi:hypothetical protein